MGDDLTPELNGLDTCRTLSVCPNLSRMRRVEVFTGAGRRRIWTTERKAQIIAESCDGGTAGQSGEALTVSPPSC